MSDSSVKFEELVENLLSAQLVRHGPFGHCMVYRNKRYVGLSGQEHQVDVAVELDVAGISVLILIECKYYSRKVGLDDILELSGRIDDVRAHKGVLVTTKGFQAGALKVAKARNIGLVIASRNQWGPVLRRDVDEPPVTGLSVFVDKCMGDVPKDRRKEVVSDVISASRMSVSCSDKLWMYTIMHDGGQVTSGNHGLLTICAWHVYADLMGALPLDGNPSKRG